MSQRKEARPPMILRHRMKHDGLLDETVLEILARMPVKSLLRFRCVCKTWYSFITNPNFISTHLLCYNHDDDGCVIHMPRSNSLRQICTVAFDRSFETISEFRIPFNFQSGHPEFMGSCNGILCFVDHRKFAIVDVYLWNPSIIKFKRLPDTCLTQLPIIALGFGFDSQNNDYKVVRILWIDPKPMPPPEVQVYSLSSDSWIRVELGISWIISCFPMLVSSTSLGEGGSIHP
ncbi:F-box protein At3g08750-like [Castanea sativa]|uniref:F-box protein At3g08750-like n=1 Tax=Castanea sativa TaxID=21020 RepID=UPI003F651954